MYTRNATPTRCSAPTYRSPPGNTPGGPNGVLHVCFPYVVLDPRGDPGDDRFSPNTLQSCTRCCTSVRHKFYLYFTPPVLSRLGLAGPFSKESHPTI